MRYEIKNQRLSREFVFEDGCFYTRSIHNYLADKILPCQYDTEFELYFEDAKVLSSAQMHANILEASNERLRVQFTHDLAEIQIVYQAREDVLAKTFAIIHSERVIKEVVADCLQFEDASGVYLQKKQADIPEMANFSGGYVAMGQPLFAKGLFMGMEFPLAENFYDEGNNTYTSRYYLGRENPQRTLHATVIGAAPKLDKSTIEEHFFAYIYGISQKPKLRFQFNSWFDYMKAIDEEKIMTSFQALYDGFKQADLKLTTYAIDDGWNDYESFWAFNHKFPEGLKKVQRFVQDELEGELGLWLGPRGGYGGTAQVMANWLESHPELGQGSKNYLSNDVNVGDPRYLDALEARMLELQTTYDLNYWKIDGVLLKPDVPDSQFGLAKAAMTAVYERYLALFTRLRIVAKSPHFWINLTSYVNPSPWFLKWVNSLWLQTSEDVEYLSLVKEDEEVTAYLAGAERDQAIKSQEGLSNSSTNKFTEPKLAMMLSYRDSKYYEFILKRDLHLPFWSLYNHEPIYAKTMHEAYFQEPIKLSPEELETYLRFIATRGMAFWEFYYSPEMMTSAHWAANGRALHWVKSHYDSLKLSRFIGGDPAKGQIYGYDCQSILSLRNPLAEKQYTNLVNSDAYDITYKLGDVEALPEGGFALGEHAIVILSKKNKTA